MALRRMSEIVLVIIINDALFSGRPALGEQLSIKTDSPALIGTKGQRWGNLI